MVSQVRHPWLRAGQKMDHHSRSLTRICAAALVSAGLALAACAAESEDYATWMAGHAKLELSGRGGRGDPALKLVITQFTEPEPPRPGARPNPFDGESTNGIEMS